MKRRAAEEDLKQLRKTSLVKFIEDLILEETMKKIELEKEDESVRQEYQPKSKAKKVRIYLNFPHHLKLFKPKMFCQGNVEFLAWLMERSLTQPQFMQWVMVSVSLSWFTLLFTFCQFTFFCLVCHLPLTHSGPAATQTLLPSEVGAV